MYTLEEAVVVDTRVNILPASFSNKHMHSFNVRYGGRTHDLLH